MNLFVYWIKISTFKENFCLKKSDKIKDFHVPSFHVQLKNFELMLLPMKRYKIYGKKGRAEGRRTEMTQINRQGILETFPINPIISLDIFYFSNWYGGHKASGLLISCSNVKSWLLYWFCHFWQDLFLVVKILFLIFFCLASPPFLKFSNPTLTVIYSLCLSRLWYYLCFDQISIFMARTASSLISTMKRLDKRQAAALVLPKL